MDFIFVARWNGACVLVFIAGRDCPIIPPRVWSTRRIRMHWLKERKNTGRPQMKHLVLAKILLHSFYWIDGHPLKTSEFWLSFQCCCPVKIQQDRGTCNIAGTLCLYAKATPVLLLHYSLSLFGIIVEGFCVLIHLFADLLTDKIKVKFPAIAMCHY